MTQEEVMPEEHPVFVRVKAMKEPWRSHFPKSKEEAAHFDPRTEVVALSSKVLCVATTRIEGTWRAYCDAVPGMDHDAEWDMVLRQGSALIESWARGIFPGFADVKYSR
jgi:hypothetical protein